MPADRGPSGTGHDTACVVSRFSSRICAVGTKGCTADHAVPADPVVSPADTPAYKRLAAMLAEGEGLDDGQPMYSPLGELRAFKAEFDALLAVGERDRQQIARLTEALERLEPLQQRVLGIIERNGFVFRTPLGKPDNERTEAERWEKLAFTLYSELCEADSVVRAVLAGEEDARP